MFKHLILAALCCGIFAGPAMAKDFEAKIIMRTTGMTTVGHLWRKGDRIRQELNTPGMPTVVISDMNSGTTITLVQASKTFMETPGQGLQSDKDLEQQAKKIRLGEETFNGWLCDKHRYDFHDPNLGSMTQWVAKDLDFAVRTVNESPGMGRMSIELADIRIKEVDPALFEVPVGYRKQSLPAMPNLQ